MGFTPVILYHPDNPTILIAAVTPLDLRQMERQKYRHVTARAVGKRLRQFRELCKLDVDAVTQVVNKRGCSISANAWRELEDGRMNRTITCEMITQLAAALKLRVTQLFKGASHRGKPKLSRTELRALHTPGIYEVKGASSRRNVTATIYSETGADVESEFIRKCRQELASDVTVTSITRVSRRTRTLSFTTTGIDDEDRARAAPVMRGDAGPE